MQFDAESESPPKVIHDFFAPETPLSGKWQKTYFDWFFARQSVQEVRERKGKRHFWLWIRVGAV